MKIFPAIDLYEGKAVRLFKGDYERITVYSDNPPSLARDFEAAGAEYIHVVDLEGAKDGTTPNIEIVAEIVNNTSLFVEIGGGIRNMETLRRYFSVGVSRAILGTAAVCDEAFLSAAVKTYGDKIAVGADVKDGYVAIRGWVEKSEFTLDAFLDLFNDECTHFGALGCLACDGNDDVCRSIACISDEDLASVEKIVVIHLNCYSLLVSSISTCIGLCKTERADLSTCCKVGKIFLSLILCAVFKNRRYTERCVS